MTKELRAINRWLKKEGNTEALLASRLKYRSSTVITMWRKRNSVPEHMKLRLKEALA